MAALAAEGGGDSQQEQDQATRKEARACEGHVPLPLGAACFPPPGEFAAGRQRDVKDIQNQACDAEDRGMLAARDGVGAIGAWRGTCARKRTSPGRMLASRLIRLLRGHRLIAYLVRMGSSTAWHCCANLVQEDFDSRRPAGGNCQGMRLVCLALL